MPIFRLNHAVLYVRDLERSVAFYRDVLGFKTVMTMGGAAAFIQAPGSTNDHDLGLFQIGPAAGPRRPGGARSASTTWPGRPTPWRSWSGWPAVWPRPAPRGRLGPRHDQEPVRQGPRRPRVRGCLGGPGRPAGRGRPGRPRAHRPPRPGAREAALRRRHQRRRWHLGAGRLNPAHTEGPPGFGGPSVWGTCGRRGSIRWDGSSRRCCCPVTGHARSHRCGWPRCAARHRCRWTRGRSGCSRRSGRPAGARWPRCAGRR